MMKKMKIGFTLSSEEFDPRRLVKLGQMAEDAGFDFVSISDHFHPWINSQGQSPFVWSVIGGLSQVTSQIEVLVGVNCPILRIHPAIVAQAAATSQVMLDGRFILGVGTGEYLNEHIIGRGWPPIAERREMLTEAIEIIRKLWSGGYQNYRGNYYQIEEARLFTLPQKKIPLIYSAFGSIAAKEAGRLGDGFITTSANEQLTQTFEQNGGEGKPKYAQINICFDQSEKKAKELIKNYWPNKGFPEGLNTELKSPKEFDSLAKLITLEQAAEQTPAGKDPQQILDSIKKYQEAGFDHIYIHNIGPNQEHFLEFASQQIIPILKKTDSQTKIQADKKLEQLRDTDRFVYLSKVSKKQVPKKP